MTRLTGDGAAEALNRLAREQCKTKLLAELHALIAHFSPCPVVAS